MEIYTHEDTQSISSTTTYSQWSENFLKDIIEKSVSLLTPNGVSCWNVAKVGKNDMNVDVQVYHKNINFIKQNEFSVISSNRPSSQKKNIKKSSDDTVVYADLV